jgi:hypothetical protein
MNITDLSIPVMERTIFMRQWLIGMTVLALAVLAARAEDKSKAAGPSPEFQKLQKELDEAQAKYTAEVRARQQEAMKALREAKTDEERKEAQKKMMVNMKDGPGPQFAARFLEFAENNPKDPSALDAAVQALRLSGGPLGHGEVWTKALASLEKNYVTRPEIKKAFRVVVGVPDENARKLLEAVMAKNPDRKIQAAACKTLMQANTNIVQFADAVKNRPGIRPQVDAQLGKEYVDQILAGADKAKKDAEEWSKVLKDKYSDTFPDLSVGKPAPEVVSQDVNGK